MNFLGFVFFISTIGRASEPQFLHLYSGYVTKIMCDGRLLASGIGNESIVRREPLPKELGCGIWLQPLSTSGSTNLILETSAGSVHVILEIATGHRPGVTQLEYRLKGDLK